MNSCVIRNLQFHKEKNGCVSLTVNCSLKTKLIKISIALIDTYSFVRD